MPSPNPEDRLQAQLSFFDRTPSDPIVMNTIQTDAETEPAACVEDAQVEAHADAVAPAVATDDVGDVHDEPLGQRLRAARKARGLSCTDAARTLKLPLSVLRALEAEQFERIGHGVYLRGYLSKYLHLLELPQVLADRVLQQHVALPPLTTAVTMSRPRYLFERYSGSALYLILTAVFVVPAVLLAMHGGLDRNLVRIAPLDAPSAKFAASAVAIKPLPETASAAAAPVANAPPVKPDESPLIASMTPFPAPAAMPTTSRPAAVDTVRHHLQLSLTEPSWVEIDEDSGKKLEYGLLPAGSVRDYASDQAIDVHIGNANGVTLTIDGKPQDLSDFRRANVAHLKVVDGVVSPSPSHSGG